MAAGAGKVALVEQHAALSGTCPAGNIDFVGFGTAANCAEGNAPTPAPCNTLGGAARGRWLHRQQQQRAPTSPPAHRPAQRRVAARSAAAAASRPVASPMSAADEGSGSRTFFTLTLTQPAGAGGVSFDYATADGTATGRQRLHRRQRHAAIAEGAHQRSVAVAVSGDTGRKPTKPSS